MKHWAEIRKPEEMPEFLNCCENASRAWSMLAGTRLVIDLGTLKQYESNCRYCKTTYPMSPVYLVVEPIHKEGLIHADSLHIDEKPI